MSDNDTGAKVADIPEELTIFLKNPVSLTNGDEPLTSFTLREPLLKHIVKFSQDSEKIGALAAMTQLIASVSGKSVFYIENIGAGEGKQAREYLALFL